METGKVGGWSVESRNPHAGGAADEKGISNKRRSNFAPLFVSDYYQDHQDQGLLASPSALGKFDAEIGLETKTREKALA